MVFNFDLDIDPENETNNLIHDLLFDVDDDEHKAEGFSSNHRTIKTYKKAYKTGNKFKLHTSFLDTLWSLKIFTSETIKLIWGWAMPFNMRQ